MTSNSNTPRITRSPVLSTSLILVAVGVLAQALLAGMFLTGGSGARLAHTIVGMILPYLAVVPVVAAWIGFSRGLFTSTYAVLVTLLPVILFVQEALGHMPFAEATVIHIPLGVALFGLASLLAVHALRGRALPGPRADERTA